MKNMILIVTAVVISMSASNAMACAGNKTGVLNKAKYDVASLTTKSEKQSAPWKKLKSTKRNGQKV